MPARTRQRHAYRDPAYVAARRRLGRGDVACAYGCGRAADSLDHVPALALHHHERDSGCCDIVPCCHTCNARRGVVVKQVLARRRAARKAASAPSRAW